MDFSPSRGRKRWVMFLALAVSVGALGCGSSEGKVSGKVTYKGAPLKGGNVYFTTADNKTEMSQIDEDGSYTIPQVPPGPVKISVETASLKKTGSRKSYGPKDIAPGTYTPPDPTEAKRRYVEIPARYEDPQQSGLTYTVTRGSQTHDINLD
jgi:hypothetical protein